MYARKRTPDDRRKAQLAAIHASKKQRAMDDDTYRDLLESITQQRSAAGLDEPQRKAVLDHMRQLGGARPRSTAVGQHPGKPANLNSEPMLQKIEALLAELKAPWSYADGIAKRMFKIQRVAWLRKQDHLTAVISALDVELRKRTNRQCIAECFKRLGMNEKTATERLPKNWRSNRNILQAMRDELEARVALLNEQAAP